MEKKQMNTRLNIRIFIGTVVGALASSGLAAQEQEPVPTIVVQAPDGLNEKQLRKWADLNQEASKLDRRLEKLRERMVDDREDIEEAREKLEDEQEDLEDTQEDMEKLADDRRKLERKRGEVLQDQ